MANTGGSSESARHQAAGQRRRECVSWDTATRPRQSTRQECGGVPTWVPRMPLGVDSLLSSSTASSLEISSSTVSSTAVLNQIFVFKAPPKALAFTRPSWPPSPNAWQFIVRPSLGLSAGPCGPSSFCFIPAAPSCVRPR